jgi:hypothetical protein
MRDLFGNEHPEPRGPQGSPVSLALIDAAAERNALASGRPVSQQPTEILAPRLSRRVECAACVRRGDTNPPMVLRGQQCLECADLEDFGS